MRNDQSLSLRSVVSLATTLCLLSACSRTQTGFDFNKLSPDEKEQKSSDDLYLKKFSSSSSSRSNESSASGESGAAASDSAGTADSTSVSSDSAMIYPDPYCYPPYAGYFQQRVFLDKNNNNTADDNEELGTISAFRGNISARKNYNYYSASAHPINGPQPEPYISKIFLYQNAKGAHLNFFHNIDGNGSEENHVKWTIRTANNFLRDRREFSDDRLELRETTLIPFREDVAVPPPDIYFPNEKIYTANWRYWKNTDGGVIGPFANYSESTVKITMEKLGDIQNIQFVSQDGQIISVANNGTPMTFILKTITPRIIPIAYTNGVSNPAANPVNSDHAVISDCLPPPTEIPVTLEFQKVTSTELQVYNNEGCGQNGLACPAMIRAPEYIVVGTGQSNTLGLTQTQITAHFGEQFSDCGGRAKTAQMNNRGLRITGKTSAFDQYSPTETNIYFTEISSCEVYY